ncbi:MULTISPECIES: OmpA family protein [unclassified Novosphingobium]|uniref:OmpA family protein n=1 Tax=unclassified Novosphingobium TaxID=2644732 RepID=UPI001359C609|nr:MULTISPECIES: OmpA family protein [unclassified Novosphingobium]
MSVISHSPRVLLMVAMLAGTAAGSVSAQTQGSPDGDLSVTVSDTSPTDRSAMTEGPEVKGIISARSGAKVQVTSDDGNRTVVTVDDATKISASKGLFGLGNSKLAATSLLNGLPVSIKTLQGGGTLLASEIKLQNKDLKTATMIRNGTDQGFAEQTAATEALRGRMGDIGKYNIKGTTNVNFDTGKYALSPEAKQSLCAAASSAEGMDNALLLVVGYTDSTGNPEFNQVLSEKRAGGVVNFLQQACHWKPYRMLTPTGMSEADPLADNSTEEGKAQNRRVAVNILVSKGLDGL